MEQNVLMSKVGRWTARFEEISCDQLDLTKKLETLRKSKALFEEKLKNDIEKINEDKNKRMEDIVCQCDDILRQIKRDKFATPFNEPVDSVRMKLHDYHQIIKEPMDLGTISICLRGKGAKVYTHPRQVYDDVRLTFHNALTYNPERHLVYIWAKVLLKKWEDKWEATITPKLKVEVRD